MDSTRLLLLAVVLTGLCRCAGRAAEERVYRSPDGIYEVHLIGQFGPTSNPLVLQRVKAVVREGGSIYADLGTIYDFDWFDTDFDRAYHRQEWPTPRTFRIAGGPPEGRVHDRLRVINATGQPLRYVFCTAEDMLLLFDVDSGAVVDNEMPRQTNNPYLNSRAQLADGTVVSQAQNFTPASSPDDVNQFIVTVDRTGIRLAVQFEHSGKSGS